MHRHIPVAGPTQRPHDGLGQRDNGKAGNETGTDIDRCNPAPSTTETLSGDEMDELGW
jgi:hypothetical protein